MDEQAKERLVAEFRACLDDWDAVQTGDGTGDDAGTDGVTVDLAQLFAELAVLRNEVRTEARQFKSALEQMHTLADLLGEQNQRLTRDLERARDAAAAAQRQTERRLLLDLLDLRDRISAALEVYRAYRPGALALLASTETRLAKGLGEGIALTLGRIDDVLAERRVRPIEAVGERLDPHTMRVQGTGLDPALPTGTVLSEVRRGYLRDDELLREAEVIVNKLGNES